MDSYAAVILAGGGGRRLGGVDKPMLPVRGTAMIDRVLQAVSGAATRTVVGPPSLHLPPGVRRVLEDPPGGGPVAAAATGLAALGGGEPAVALLAADLPFLDPAAITTLRTALARSTLDGVVFVDGDGRRQTLCGVWRTAALCAALARIGPPGGVALRALLAGLRIGEVSAALAGPPPWYDCDEPDDLHRAEEWI